ncbi:MAG: AMP-binding protein [Hyphomicrobiaceae bacterium]|nr:AMP-binding protein [Hyphomicrobiaceae bacterium]
MYGYRGVLPPEHFNMARYCLETGETRPHDKIGLIVIRSAEDPSDTETWTYGEIEDAVLRIAAGLHADGLEAGDRLVIRLANTSDYALLFFGAIAAGLVPLPASSVLSAREVNFFLQDCGARALAMTPELPLGDIPKSIKTYTPADVRSLRSRSEPAVYAETHSDDPALLIYTSGTTARPKGVLHAQRSVWGRRPMYEGWYGMTAQDRMLHAGAFNWTYTLGTGLCDPWINGATALVYTGEKDPSVWLRLMAQHEATIFAAVPTLYRQILKYGDLGAGMPPTLRHGLTAGETLPQDLAREWREKTGTTLYEALGMSEVSTYISSSPSVPPKPGKVGKPQQGREVVILPTDGGTEPLPRDEEGLIAVHRTDPALMLGYWNRPEEEQAVMRGDWFCGGDIGAMDEDGYITHLGRNDDLMNALGYRVSPMEVEQVLASHPDVAEVAVTEIGVRRNVSVIGAFVVMRDGADPDKDTLQALAQDKLADYKMPREYVFLDALPRTPNGKVKRGELRRTYQRNATQNGHAL